MYQTAKFLEKRKFGNILDDYHNLQSYHDIKDEIEDFMKKW